MKVLWADRWLIVACMVIFALLGGAYSLLVPVEYESSATISVGAPRGGQPAGFADSFVRVLQSQLIAERVVEEFKLVQRTPSITPSTFTAQVLTVHPVPQTSLVRVVIRIDDPAIAAALANRVAGLGIETARQLAQDEITASERELKSALEHSERGLTAADQAYATFAGTAQIELLMSDVETSLRQRAQFQALIVQLEAERARLAKAEKELEAHDRTSVTVQSIDSNPALMEAARQAVPDRSPLGLQMKEERPNEVYATLDRLVAETRTNVAALERERAELIASSGVEAPRLKRIAELYEKQGQLERLDLERQLARQTYEDVAERYQSARLTVVERTPQFLVVDPARNAEQPLSRFVARNILLGLVSGALLAFVITLSRHSLSSSTQV